MNRLEAKNSFAVKHTGQLQMGIRFGLMFAHMCRLFFAYMIMLAVMTFNACILLAIVLGFTTGYFLFGFSEISFDLVSNEGRFKNTEYATPNLMSTAQEESSIMANSKVY